MDLRSLLSGHWSRRAAPASAAASAVPTPRPAPPAAALGGGDAGYPLQAVDELLATHDELLRRIKLAYGADQQAFTDDILAVVRRYAAYVNGLPATAGNYFSAPGGLLRIGLEIGFYALQATDGQIFSGRATISQRRQLEPRWRQATFIAGLCSELHRSLSHVQVTDQRGRPWPAYLAPLSGWLQQQRADRFFVRWIRDPQELRALGILALPYILPAGLLQHLAHDNTVVVPQMLASIGGLPLTREHNILEQLVARAAALVIARDLHAMAERGAQPPPGAHLARYLLDACRRLVRCHDGWAPNSDRSRVWFGQDGLFLVWPHAAMEISGVLEDDRLPGMPTSPAAMQAILAEAGVIEPPQATQATWQIHPPEGKSALDAIKFLSPAFLLAALAAPPAPLPCHLTRPRRASAAPPSPTAVTAGTPERQAPPATASRPEPTPITLRAPPRLDPALHAALADIIGTLNRDATPACCRVQGGLFIPLSELEKRQVDATMAMRTLAKQKVLASDLAGNASTIIHACGGAERTRGIVIALEYLDGIAAAGIAAPATVDGNRHARPAL